MPDQTVESNSTMKQIALLLMVLTSGLTQWSRAQTTTVDCDMMNLIVNVGSNPTSINIYHPGGYLTWPHSGNVMEWEFADAQGNVLHEETLVNDNFVSFGFDMPITDTMSVHVLLSNDSAFHNGNPVACLVEDYLFWEVTETIPGTFTSSWTLGGSVGVDVSEPVEPPCSLQYDGDGDGTVTVVDVLGLLGEFGQSCEDPSYAVEGRWLWSPSENVADANTMYEFADGLRYTFYCATAECDEAYWNSLDTSEALPNTDSYSFDGDTLTIDEWPHMVTFDCDGGVLHFSNGGKLWRLGSDCP